MNKEEWRQKVNELSVERLNMTIEQLPPHTDLDNLFYKELTPEQAIGEAKRWLRFLEGD